MSELKASVSCSPQCAETDNIKSTDDINPETVQNTNTNISQVEEGESISWNPSKTSKMQSYGVYLHRMFVFELFEMDSWVVIKLSEPTS